MAIATIKCRVTFFYMINNQLRKNSWSFKESEGMWKRVAADMIWYTEKYEGEAIL